MITAAGSTAKTERSVWTRNPRRRPLCRGNLVCRVFIQHSDTCDSHWTAPLFLSEAAESVWNWNLGAIFGWKKWRIFSVIQKFCVSQTQEQISAVFSFPTSLTFCFFYTPPPRTSSSNLTLLSPSEGDSQAALRRKSTQTCLHFCE